MNGLVVSENRRLKVEKKWDKLCDVKIKNSINNDDKVDYQERYMMIDETVVIPEKNESIGIIDTVNDPKSEIKINNLSYNQGVISHKNEDDINYNLNGTKSYKKDIESI